MGRPAPGKWRAEPRSEPDSGKPTVRDRRGACGAMSHGSRRLRTTSKGVGRPPDPKATCAADLSRHPHAGFDEAGAGDVAMGAGLRPRAKAMDEPPDPTVRAPVLDPTGGGRRRRGQDGYRADRPPYDGGREL